MGFKFRGEFLKLVEWVEMVGMIVVLDLVIYLL